LDSDKESLKFPPVYEHHTLPTENKLMAYGVFFDVAENKRFEI